MKTRDKRASAHMAILWQAVGWYDCINLTTRGYTMTKHILWTMAVMSAVVAAPYAAGMEKDVSTTKMPAVATPNSYNPNAPVDGRNSFTQAQVAERIAKAGFTNVRDLAQGDDGIWRGQADKKGKTQSVMFDYQGNITTGTSSSVHVK